MSDVEIEIDFNEKDKKLLMLILLIFSLFLIFYGCYQSLLLYDCQKIDGFLLENKSCYLPGSEDERNQIEKQGYVKLEENNEIDWGGLNQ